MFLSTFIEQIQKGINMFISNKIWFFIFCVFSKTIISGQFIGSYATPYNFLLPIYKQELNIKLGSIIPESLLTALANKLEIDIQDLTVEEQRWLIDEQISNLEEATFLVSIRGEPIDGPVASKIYNICFHDQVKSWNIGKPDFNPLEFSIPVDMGLFEPNGVQQDVSNPIAFNSFNPEQVSIHGDGVYYSPNNAAFRISDRQIASFWTSAVAADHKKIIVTFDIIINNPELQELLITIIGSEDLSAAKLVMLISMMEAKCLSELDIAAFRELLSIINF